jgi:chromosome segregation ATPase
LGKNILKIELRSGRTISSKKMEEGMEIDINSEAALASITNKNVSEMTLQELQIYANGMNRRYLDALKRIKDLEDQFKYTDELRARHRSERETTRIQAANLQDQVSRLTEENEKLKMETTRKVESGTAIKLKLTEIQNLLSTPFETMPELERSTSPPVDEERVEVTSTSIVTSFGTTSSGPVIYGW